VARFKRRMDLELYQKISFSGYNKIDPEMMRITRISYSRSAANDIVEIEFSKDQAIQQLRRIARAVNPDYVSGAQDMMNTDLSDIGLVDTFGDPIAGGTAADDLWEVPAALRPTDAVMAQTLMLDVRGLGIYNAASVSGRADNDLGFWGWSTLDESNTEFARWRSYADSGIIRSYLEIKSDLHINNDSRFPKIYFDIDAFRPTYIGGNWYDGGGDPEQSFDAFRIVVGGTTMMRFTNPDSGSEWLEIMRDLIIHPNLIMGGAIKGYGNNDLEFKVSGTGKFKFTVE